jgi:hypothetical protein
LSYYSARYLAPWLARWISPDSQGADGLNLYVYVGNNPLKYIDPTGRVKVVDGKERALILNAPLLFSDSMINFVVAFSMSSLLAGYV